MSTQAPHIVLAPDSYKGSASALEIAHALAEGLQTAWPHARLTLAPMADGGEGTLDCLAAGRDVAWQSTSILAIHGERIDAPWFCDQAGTAVIESAQVLGLPLIEAQPNAPRLQARGSHALGELIAAALDTGIHDLVIGLGGSACNDAGLGLLSALGAHATAVDGTQVAPTMDGLLALDRIDLTGLDARLQKTRIRVLCDVDNPLLGERGASRVYGPQKGLSDADIEAVEAAFIRLADSAAPPGLATATGSGAAGGLGFALALIGGELCSGANTLLDMTGLRETLADADLVITGEGRSDTQTLSGKLPLAIADAAKPTPTVLLSGAIADEARTELGQHFAGCYTLVERAGSVAEAVADPLRWARVAAADIGADLGSLITPADAPEPAQE
ncbi:glycerate kinase protein [Salinisphaera shabanensis E1L3A]|jgi:glycerate kinase|uniref:Glycerate kinase protein n=1 Tax=Salinisphaera shabanensis E1L3A TaxID=1033802 RepID=U2FX97_9GAMM|nr:glycerate kinase [Salinisphaera shabanensis]ERJ20479.1 glycerate kinase protein [Salinisphaera shabanensis E1L3A]